jgi:hypothetical protein
VPRLHEAESNGKKQMANGLLKFVVCHLKCFGLRNARVTNLA